jgi:hypothetical protein
MADLIAERTFDRRDDGGPVTVRIHAPKKDNDWSGWSAKVEIAGLPETFQADVIGVDAFQALYLALRAVCRELETVEPLLMFEGHSAALPIVMPWEGDVSRKGEVYRFIMDNVAEAVKQETSALLSDRSAPTAS